MERMKRKVLVTGATGLVGSHVLIELSKQAIRRNLRLQT